MGGGQLTHMGDIHFPCECCRRRKGEPDLEVRAGFLEEVSLGQEGHQEGRRAGPQGGKMGGSTAGWTAFGLRTQAWLVIITVQLETRK